MYLNRHLHKYIIFEKTVKFDSAIDENEMLDNTVMIL